MGGGGQSFFELKNAFKIGRTFSNVRWQVWLNAGFFGIFFSFLKLQLFYQLQPEVEKLRFFWDFQYSENHRILLKINFLYMYEFLFKLNACKLISKLSTHTFYICLKKLIFASACAIWRSLENLFWKFDIFILGVQKYQIKSKNWYFRHQMHF